MDWIYCCIVIERHIQHKTIPGILNASSAEDDNNSHVDDDDNPGGLLNNKDSQDLSDSETHDQGELETEPPPILDVPLLPHTNAPVVTAVIDAPTLFQPPMLNLSTL